MWAHHPSAWTGNTPHTPSENVNIINAGRRRSISKRRKTIVDGTVKNLRNEELREYYLQFVSKWYENREEAIKIVEFENFPVEIRSNIWEFCSRSCELIEQSPGAYERLFENMPNDQKFVQNIEMDIQRTLPCVDHFDEKKVSSMKNILIAYSVKDNVLGYAQGMNYLAATILYLLPEENAFWLLMRLMKGYSLEKLYPSPLCELHECLGKFDILLKIYMPEIQKKLMELGAELQLYIPQWFQTIFLYTQRVDLSIRVLDMVIVHGIEALFRVGLAIISLAHDVLMSEDMTFILVIDILKNLNLSILTTTEIIRVALAYPTNILVQTIEYEYENSVSDSFVYSECTIS